MSRGFMPIFKYFVLVGGCLLVLLLATDRYLPRPVERAAAADADRSIIRIRSARVGPEKVEFDTAQPPRTEPAIQGEPHDDLPRETYHDAETRFPAGAARTRRAGGPSSADGSCLSQGAEVAGAPDRARSPAAFRLVDVRWTLRKPK
jgi:hypothetical protein